MKNFDEFINGIKVNESQIIFLTEGDAFEKEGQEKVYKKFLNDMDTFSRTTLEDALKKEYPKAKMEELINMADEISDKLEKNSKYKGNNLIA